MYAQLCIMYYGKKTVINLIIFIADPSIESAVLEYIVFSAWTCSHPPIRLFGNSQKHAEIQNLGINFNPQITMQFFIISLIFLYAILSCPTFSLFYKNISYFIPLWGLVRITGRLLLLVNMVPSISVLSDLHQIIKKPIFYTQAIVAYEFSRNCIRFLCPPQASKLLFIRTVWIHFQDLYINIVLFIKIPPG